MVYRILYDMYDVILSRADNRQRERKTLLPHMRKKNSRLNCNSKMGPKIDTFHTFYIKTNGQPIKTHACGIKYQRISININTDQQISTNINKYQSISTNVNKYQ